MPKICFVIMGFGKKTDYETGRTLDLDKTYKNIIQPAVKEVGFECVRADEIRDSKIIDKSMYALLIRADLVIADISTFNPNAIYELGVRHAVKPYSTIIIKEERGNIPFDLDHTRIFQYKHFGEDIGATEAKRCQDYLTELIKKVDEKSEVDSPFYEYIDIDPPKISEEEYQRIVDELAEDEKHLFAIVEKAKNEMNKSNFDEAEKQWAKASEKLPNESYYKQQQALCKYKSEKPSKKTALTDALSIINDLDLDGNTNDPETLGIAGAINRRLYEETNDTSFLDRAIEYYGRGFKVRDDYYTGENYAFCLNLKLNEVSDSDEKIYCQMEAKKTREKIIKKLSNIEADELDNREDEQWIYATLSTCYMALGDKKKSKKYEKEFMKMNPATWELDTFKESREKLNKLL